jgi:predicted permease
MKLYRLLLNLYPARFREEYGGPLEQQFLDEYREAQTAGARFRLWLTALRDLAWSIPIELAHELRQDLAHSLRVHARRPFVMTFTIAILALAIGGATGVFSVVNAVLIKSLPFRDPDRLMLLSNLSVPSTSIPGSKGQVAKKEVFLSTASAPGSGATGFENWRNSSVYLEDAAVYTIAEMNITGTSSPIRVTVAETSYNFFSMLGSEPVLGRAFAPGEDVPGNDNAVIVSHALWQQLYGNDPRVLGSKILLNGVPMTVVGVARPGFDYPAKASVWIPTAFDIMRVPAGGVFFWRTIGRLKPGLTMTQAQKMLEADGEHLDPGRKREDLERLELIPLRAQLAANTRQASLVLLGAIGFVLLIACANVANLLLTRTAERRSELMIRAALGASRARLTQQLLSESVLLSAIAAVASLGIAYWASKLAAVAQPAELAAQKYTIFDWRVAGFAIGIALVTGILSGVVPAWLIRNLQPSGDLARTQGPAPRAGRLRGVLIAIQVALTVVLLAGSATMARGFLRLLGTDIGFQPDHLVTLSVSLTGTPQESDSRKAGYYRDVLLRLRSVQDVESAAAIDFLPLEAHFFIGGNLLTESGVETPPVIFGRVTPDYFRTMDTRIVYGREFTAADRGRVAILTEGVASKIAEGSSIIGRRVRRSNEEEPFTVIGVVRAIRYQGPAEPGMEQMFVSAASNPPIFATFIAKVSANAADALARCRDAVQSVDRDVPVFAVKTFRQRLDETLAAPRFRTTIFLFFGGFALLLAIAGIYGVSSYSVTQRRREIGVRIAIGASARGVRAMVLRQALWPIGAGMSIGLIGAAWQGRLLGHLLPAAPPVDVPAAAAAAVVLALVAIFAIWSATRRILELNPIEVLKWE